VVLAFSVFALAVFYGSKVIVAYLVSERILKRFYPPASRYRFVILLLGVVLFVLLRSIPYLGWAVEVVVVVLGLGGLWLALRRQPPAAVQTAEQAM
jgi:hypothetical protein